MSFLTLKRRHVLMGMAATAALPNLSFAQSSGPVSGGTLKISHSTRIATLNPLILSGPAEGRRSEIVQALKAQGVGSSVYYPGPVPALRYYSEKYGLKAEDFPNATRISHQSIALPVGPHLDENDMDRITEAMKRAIHDVCN